MRKIKNQKAQVNGQEFSYEWKRIEYFFEWFDPEEATEEFWKILKLALTADNEKADKRERSNMIFFYEHATELFENLFKIWKGGKRANVKM